MKLQLKEDPKEWRKFVTLSATGLSLMTALLCWRKILPALAFAVILVILGGIVLAAWLQPRWFRGAYRAGATVGFHIAQVLGQVVLAVLFLLVLTPLGLILRLTGKDLLRLKRAPKAESHWQPARPATPLERLF
jgi:hypothetical protein